MRLIIFGKFGTKLLPLKLLENKNETFQIVLNTQPIKPVNITGFMMSDSGSITRLRVAFQPASLQFNAFNWNISQPIQICAEDDEIDDVLETASYVLTYYAQSEDQQYHSLKENCTILVEVADDDVAGVSLMQHNTPLKVISIKEG